MGEKQTKRASSRKEILYRVYSAATSMRLQPEIIADLFDENNLQKLNKPMTQHPTHAPVRTEGMTPRETPALKQARKPFKRRPPCSAHHSWRTIAASARLISAS